MEGWPDGFRHVEIDSPLDATVQDAVFRRAMSDGRPLAVVLHTWSGSFETQSDSLYQEVLDRDWNYIYPDFRGANDTPKACCSLSALTDLDAAIDFALEHTDALPSEVHVIGASGGGYAALCLLMRSKHRLPYVGAWVPITDLLAWHDESLARANGYDEDIRLCTSGDEEVLHVREARHRSPLYMRARLPPSNTVIQLYAGIDDGYTGSVPISHTLEFFNRLLDDFGAPEPARVPPEHFALLVDEQRVPSGETTTGSLDDREILYHRDHGALSVDIFDGGHEMLQHAALDQAGAATGVE